MNTILKVGRQICMIVFCLSLVACSQSNSILQQPPVAVKGVIDLREWDFEKKGSIDLIGEWDFFWNKLLGPNQITDSGSGYHVSVPGIWTNYNIKGTMVTPKGYATYRLLVYLPDKDQVYGLYTEGQGTAYSLWIDDRLLSRNGIVGKDDQAMVPEKKPNTIFFRSGGEKVTLVMQISNFQHRKGGFRNKLHLGLAQPVHEHQMQDWFVEVFSIGLLFVMGFYHLFIYIFRLKNKAPLYFAILCWLWVIRLIVLNQNTFLFFQPDLSWAFALRAEYLTFFILPGIFCLLIASLYPKDQHRLFIWTVLGLGICFTVFLIFADTFMLSYTITFYQIVVFFQGIYYIYFLGLIIVRKREGAFYITLALVISFVTIFIESLYFQNLLPYGRVAHYGFLAFIFVQAILLASIFSESFKRVENLSGELEGVNILLGQSEKKYRNIFENSKDIIFIASLDAQIKEINPACKEVLGYTKHEIQDNNILDDILDTLVKSRLETELYDHGQIKNIELQLQRKDGKKIDALVSATLRYDENGKVNGVQGSVRDITSRKQAETERLRSLELMEIAITDPLTNIYNRRFFYEAAEKEIERAKRNSSSLSIIMIDADFFKKINDQYGHLIGDQVLINLANLCRDNIRKMDLLARFGGEEFVILMPEAEAESTLKKAEQLRKMVAQKAMAIVDEKEVKITISLGIANWNPGIIVGINDLLDRADKALYKSKESGRNQVSVWE